MTATVLMKAKSTASLIVEALPALPSRAPVPIVDRPVPHRQVARHGMVGLMLSYQISFEDMRCYGS